MLPGTGTLTMPRGQAWQTVAQLPLVQSASTRQWPPAKHLVHIPPQSTSVSVPFTALSLQLTISQTWSAHVPLAQSASTAHPWPSTHFGHVVLPQSLSVSSPFCTPSVHDVA